MYELNKNISRLKSLIQDYESEERKYKSMVSEWEEFQEAYCDPVEQAVQKEKVYAYYSEIINFAKTLN